MRTLILLRHGKAVQADSADDHGRELAPRGVEQATVIAGLLGRLGLVPDIAFVSDAVRTVATADIALAGADTEIVLSPELYAAPAQSLLEVARRVGTDGRCVMLVGHNPGIADLARLLEGSGEPQAAVALQRGFPTGALAALDFDLQSWADLTPGTGCLTRFIDPDGSPHPQRLSPPAPLLKGKG